MRPVFGKTGWHICFLVLANGDQALAAEPGFHGDPPQGRGRVVIIIRHAPDYPAKLAEQQPENGLPLAPVPTQAWGVVVEDGARGAAVGAVPGLMVEFMGGQFYGQAHIAGFYLKLATFNLQQWRSGGHLTTPAALTQQPTTTPFRRSWKSKPAISSRNRFQWF
jgi:hypothetical protein